MNHASMLSFVLVLSLTACAPDAQPVREDRLVVEAVAPWTMQVEARLPSDLLATPDGGFLVLDGIAGHAVVYDASHQRSGTLGTPETWGHPVRMAWAKDGGIWLADATASAIRHASADGTITQEFVLEAREGEDHAIEPIAIYDAGDSLLIAPRDGGLFWMNPTTGATGSTDTDVDGQPMGVITDLIASSGGNVLAVDTLSHRIHVLSPDWTPISAFGRFGLWGGYMLKPKGAAVVGDGSVVVVDSELGVTQFFDPNGPLGPQTVLGMAAQGSEPMRFQHAIAVETWGSGYNVLVLDEATEAVTGFSVTAADLDRARGATSVRSLREPLVNHAERVAGIDEHTCRQCHDGLINDDRENWDPDRFQHPVNMVPERELPAFFPLDPEGRMRCITCHSPHGTSSVEEVQGVQNHDEVLQLVRHAPQGEFFTRLTREDSALCVACHGDSPHSDISAETGAVKSAHPSGKELLAALAKRPEGAGNAKDSCLACHAVHGAVTKTLQRADDDGASCMSCHAATRDREHTHPVNIVLAKNAPKPKANAGIPLAANGSPTCRSCHDLVGGRGEALLRRPTNGLPLCAACHEERQDVGRGSHRKVSGGQGIPCLGCHDVHGGEVARSLVIVQGASTADPTGCLTCHGPSGVAAKAGVRPGELGHPVDGRKHDDEVLSCDTCHDVHMPNPGAAATCTRCHTEQAQDKARGGHGKASCTDCHSIHGATRMASVDANPREKRCLACHSATEGRGDAPRITDFKHPVPVFRPDGSRWTPLGTLPLYAANGDEMPPKTNGELTCSTCHWTHGPDPAKPGDSLRRDGWNDACAACHGADALIFYRYFHKPKYRKDLTGGGW